MPNAAPRRIAVFPDSRPDHDGHLDVISAGTRVRHCRRGDHQPEKKELSRWPRVYIHEWPRHPAWGENTMVSPSTRQRGGRPRSRHPGTSACDPSSTRFGPPTGGEVNVFIITGDQYPDSSSLIVRVSLGGMWLIEVALPEAYRDLGSNSVRGWVEKSSRRPGTCLAPLSVQCFRPFVLRFRWSDKLSTATRSGCRSNGKRETS